MTKLNDVVKRVEVLEKDTSKANRILPKVSVVLSTIALILVFL